MKPWVEYFDQPPPAQSPFVAGVEPVVEGLADGALVPGMRGVAGEVGMPGVVGLVSPGMPGPTLGWVDGLGELPGAVVCASAGATLNTRASSTVNTMCQDLI